MLTGPGGAVAILEIYFSPSPFFSLCYVLYLTFIIFILFFLEGGGGSGWVGWGVLIEVHFLFSSRM